MSQSSALCVTCGYPLPEIRCPECGAEPERSDASTRARAALNATFPVALAINAITVATVIDRFTPRLFLMSPDPYTLTQGVTLLLWVAMLPALAMAAPRGAARRIWLLTAPVALLSWVVPSLLTNLVWFDYRAHWTQIMVVTILLAGIPAMSVLAFVLLRRAQRGLLRAVGLPEPPACRVLRLIAMAPALVLLVVVACSLRIW